MPHKHKPNKEQFVPEPPIHNIRGLKVILDSDLARIYGVSTKRFNEQVRRNRGRFPEDFMFRLTTAEARGLRRDHPLSAVRDGSEAEADLRSQFATSSSGYGGRRYLPYAFTEHGAVMAANVLKSHKAVQMSVFVVRAFVKMRVMLFGQKELADKLIELENKLTGRLDIHEAAIVDILKRMMELLDPPPPPPPPEKRPIGFRAG